MKIHIDASKHNLDAGNTIVTFSSLLMRDCCRIIVFIQSEAIANYLALSLYRNMNSVQL